MTEPRALNPKPALSLDVCAYNDVAIFCRTKPRDLADFRATLADRAWNDGSVTDEDWRLMHVRYIAWFEVYLHDAETINYRDQRQRNMGAQARKNAERGRR